MRTGSGCGRSRSWRTRSTRFGDAAVSLLIESVLAKGAHRPTLRAKLFGGACVLEAFRSQDPLGAQNVRVARARLQAEHIPIVAEDTGGDHGRKLLFELQTGDAWVRAIETRDTSNPPRSGPPRS